MANKRVFYAAKKVGLAATGEAAQARTFRQLHGIQSVGMTTTFNLEQTFELGQLAIYENIEGIPDVSIDIEKVLDGFCPVYVLATSIGGTGTEGSSSPTLTGRSNARCDFALAVYSDQDTTAGGGSTTTFDAESTVYCSGVFVNSVSYNVGIDGYATESVTMVGQDKVYIGHGSYDGGRPTFSATDLIAASNDDEPLALARDSGGVNRREDVMFKYFKNKNGVDQYPQSGVGTVLPRQIPGINSRGMNLKGTLGAAGGDFPAHLQSFSCSTDFGREDIFELGRRGRYHRFVNFPTEVSCDVGIISISGDLISATEEGLVQVNKVTGEATSVAGGRTGINLIDEFIRFELREGLHVDLGKKNKLASVSVTGGDAGGGNEEITYSFTNFNDFTVRHPSDPNFAQTAFKIDGNVSDGFGDEITS